MNADLGRYAIRTSACFFDGAPQECLTKAATPEEILSLYAQLYDKKSLRDASKVKYVLDRLIEKEVCFFHAVDRLAGDQLVGVVTLIRTGSFSKTFGLIEDLIVKENHQRRGLATALMNEAISFSCALWPPKIEYLQLTSKPDKVAANRLYQKLGFRLIASGETNLYCLYL